MLITNAIERFLAYQEAKGNSLRTVSTYAQRLRLFIEEMPGGELAGVEHITPEMVDVWVVGMRRRGLAAITVNNRLRDIKTFFSWCVGRGYLAVSPAAHLPIRGRWADHPVKAMAQDDLKQMLSTAAHPRDVAIIRFIASTGCRSGEAATVRIADVDLARREARVSGKTGSRVVDFNLATVTALQRWLNEHPNVESGYLFVSLHPPHTPINTGTIYQMFRRLANEAGITGRFNPHAVRHLVGQIWTDETNLELTRQKLGHRDISTTMVYANQDRTRLKAATDKIDIV